MDGGAWQATVHGVAKSQTRLSDFTSLCIYQIWDNSFVCFETDLAIDMICLKFNWFVPFEI